MKQKREMLEAQMKHCRSKQEVDETVNDAISHISEKDPDKQALIATYREAYKEFRKTTGYKSLPDTKKEAERRRGKGRRLLWEGNSLCEMDPWPGTAGETYGVDGLCRVGDGATPLDEIYDSMPMLDVIG